MAPARHSVQSSSPAWKFRSTAFFPDRADSGDLGCCWTPPASGILTCQPRSSLAIVGAGQAAGCFSILIDRPYSGCDDADARVDSFTAAVDLILTRLQAEVS